jgi:hypothetical protein
MCGHEDVFFKPMELLNFMVWIIVLVILNEPTIQGVITTYRQSSSTIKSSYTLHVHFVCQKKNKIKNLDYGFSFSFTPKFRTRNLI